MHRGSYLFYTFSLVCSKFIYTQRFFFCPPLRLNPIQCLTINSWKVSLVSVHRGSYLPLIRSLFLVCSKLIKLHTRRLFSTLLGGCTQHSVFPSTPGKFRASVSQVCALWCVYLYTLSRIYTQRLSFPFPRRQTYPHNILTTV